MHSLHHRQKNAVPADILRSRAQVAYFTKRLAAVPPPARRAAIHAFRESALATVATERDAVAREWLMFLEQNPHCLADAEQWGIQGADEKGGDGAAAGMSLPMRLLRKAVDLGLDAVAYVIYWAVFGLGEKGLWERFVVRRGRRRGEKGFDRLD